MRHGEGGSRQNTVSVEQEVEVHYPRATRDRAYPAERCLDREQAREERLRTERRADLRHAVQVTRLARGPADGVGLV